MRLRAVLAIVVSYLGLAVIFGEKVERPRGPDVAIGAALILSAAIAFALYQLFAKPLIATIGPRLFTCIAMTGAAIGAFIQFFAHPPGVGARGQRARAPCSRCSSPSVRP